MFLESLRADGRAPVSLRPPPPDTGGAIPILEQMQQVARTELVNAPAFNIETGLWATRLLFDLCRFTVCRDIPADEIRHSCQTQCPATRGPETDWSADLLLRHLPRVYHLAAHLSQADPLVQELKRLAAAWPLSSVGVPGVGPVSLDSFIEHKGLRRLYADRVIEAGDYSRLGDERVDNLLRMDIGLQNELAPEFARRLAVPDVQRS